MTSLRTALSTGLFLLCAACASSPDTDRAEPPSGLPASRVHDRIQELLGAGRFSAEAWRLDLSDAVQLPTHDQRIEVQDGLILVQDQNDVIRALDLARGTHQWVVDLGMPLTAQCGVDPNGVCMISGDSIVVVERDSGARLIGRVAHELEFWPATRAGNVIDSFYVGREAPYGVQAVDMATGLDGWLYRTLEPVVDLQVEGSGRLAQVVAVSADGLVVALPARPARGFTPKVENWHDRLRGARVSSRMAISGDNLVIPGEDMFLYCLHAKSGIIRWKYPAGSRFVDADPVAAGGSVYCRSEANFVAVDLETGTLQWEAEDVERFITRIGERCYVETTPGTVSVRMAADGTEVASFSVSDLRHVPTIPGGGFFLVGDGGGHLFALK